MRDKLENLKTRLDALRPFSAEQQKKIDRELIPRRVHFTNAFGDNSLTLEETRYFLETQRMVGGKLEREFQEIKGALEATRFLRQLMRDSQDLSEAIIKKLHEVLTQPIEQPERYFPGQYKHRDAPYLSKDGSLVNFVPHEKVPEEMAALMAWYQEANGKQHPVEVAARFHYRFSLIHPFMEANGRVARFLDDFILEKAGYGPAIVEHREKYYAAMRSADQSLPAGERLPAAQNTDLTEFVAAMEECSCSSMELMLDILEERFMPATKDLEARLEIFDKIISGDTVSEADRRIQEEKETTKLAIAREIEEMLKQKIRSKVVKFVLTGPAKFQHNNHQYSPLIAEVSGQHKFAFSAAEILYEYYLSPDIEEIEKNEMPVKPFMRLISFAILSHAKSVGIFSGVLNFEFGRVYIKQENRAERILRLQPESIHEMLGAASYQDWDFNELRKFVYNSLDYYFHLIELDYLKTSGEKL